MTEQQQGWKVRTFENRCGCRVEHWENSFTVFPKFIYCPRHAAAPEMYDALKDFVDVHSNLGEKYQVMGGIEWKARNALALAEGDDDE